jgi:signal transduction histidine kinase/CheY-like chemotaxis protein
MMVRVPKTHMNSTSQMQSSQGEIASDIMLKRIFDSVDVAIVMFDRDRRVIYCNKTAAMLPGFVPVGSFIDKGRSDTFSSNEYYDVDGNLLAYPRMSVIERVFQGRETHDLLLEYRNKKDHIQCWISFSAIPVMDASGKFEYGILWYRDVSERKSRDDKLKFLLESTKILSITMDFKQRLEEKARLTVPLLADWCSVDIVQNDNSIKRMALIHRDPKKVEQFQEYEKKYPLLPGVESIPERVIRTGRSEFIPLVTEEIIMGAQTFTEEQRRAVLGLGLTSVMTVPIGSGGKVLGAITLAYAESGRIYSQEDFTFIQEFTNHWRVLLENARLYREISRRDLSKDTFLAYLSHELRNPLAPIKSALELLCMKNKDQELLEDIKTINHQFNLMARLLTDLLDKTRFTSGKIKLDMRQTDLTHIVESVARAVRPIVERAHITLRVSYPKEHIVLFADPTRIEQALSNLVHNAVKFTPPGGSITIDLTQSDGEAVLRVKDTGVGISTSEIGHIFELYYQSERTRQGNQGLGLGLLLVHDIVELHGGSVEARSDGPHKGSEFIVRLPIVESSMDAPISTPDSSVGRSAVKKILVVDDNQAAADSLVRLLIALGWEDAHALYDGRSVLPYLKQHKVDTIFLDVGMPDMNGYELVTLLRERGYADLPIIALTGYGLPEDKQKALDAGFSAHLTKPIGTRELREALGGESMEYKIIVKETDDEAVIPL